MMALTKVPRVNVINQRLLLEAMGNATNLFENKDDLASVLPNLSAIAQKNLENMDEMMPRIEQEYEWAQSKHIKCLCINDAEYPARLRECPDAPLVLYYRGNADLNSVHIINMIGTRQCTEYGKDICRVFIEELSHSCPDCLIVSGLAYGIDINAHRNALQQEMLTVGVLAHGMDQIYPRLHQDTATKMLSQGGLLTEYMSGTSAEKMNFVARNRIVAGISDATIVVESAAKGGSLITADIAVDYGRDVFAFPGRIGDPKSAGCNALIHENKAHLVTSAQDVLDIMGWQTQSKSAEARQKPIQRELFVELSDEEQLVANSLHNTDGKAINQLSVELGLPIGQLSALLFGMEMRGIVKLMNGGMYRLL